jgi:DNA-damage-inducible protein J
MAVIRIKIDDETKEKAEKTCSDIGISLTDAIKIYLKKIGDEKRIPFELTADPFYSDSNIQYLKKIMADITSGNAHFAKHNLIDDK